MGPGSGPGKKGGGLKLATRFVLLAAAAAGSVAFWLWRTQRAERSRAEMPSPRLPRLPSSSGSNAEPSLPHTWAQRASRALQIGGPDGLRRLGHDLRHAGMHAEAGLLDNYAMLLEHSVMSRARVSAEVTRMLHAATADRASC